MPQISECALHFATLHAARSTSPEKPTSKTLFACRTQRLWRIFTGPWGAKMWTLNTPKFHTDRMLRLQQTTEKYAFYMALCRPAKPARIHLHFSRQKSDAKQSYSSLLIMRFLVLLCTHQVPGVTQCRICPPPAPIIDLSLTYHDKKWSFSTGELHEISSHLWSWVTSMLQTTLIENQRLLNALKRKVVLWHEDLMPSRDARHYLKL